MKLDFLQKYSTLERALELPTMVQHLEIAGKAVPLREKVCDSTTEAAARTFNPFMFLLQTRFSSLIQVLCSKHVGAAENKWFKKR